MNPERRETRQLTRACGHVTVHAWYSPHGDPLPPEAARYYRNAICNRCAGRPDPDPLPSAWITDGDPDRYGIERETRS